MKVKSMIKLFVSLIHECYYWVVRNRRLPAIGEIVVLGRAFLSRSNFKNNSENLERNSQVGVCAESDPYQLWVEVNDAALQNSYVDGYRRSANDFLSVAPLFSIVVLELTSEDVDAVFQDLKAQIEPRWEMILPFSYGQKGEPFYERDKRVVFLEDEVMADMERIARCASKSSAEYLIFIDKGIRLRPVALSELWLSIKDQDAVGLLYGDNDYLRTNGDRFCPTFKPAWSPDNFLSKNYIGNFIAVSKSAYKHVGGIRNDSNNLVLDKLIFDVAQNFPVVHIENILSSILSSSPACPEDVSSTNVRRREMLIPRSLDSRVNCELGTVTVYLNGNKITNELLDKFSRSSGYSPLKFCVLVGSENGKNELSARLDDSFPLEYILPRDGIVGPVAINQALLSCKTDYAVVLDERVTEMSSLWLSNMLASIQVDEVGVVGGITGSGSSEIEGFKFPPYPHNRMLVSGYCLLLRVSMFRSLLGFDAKKYEGDFAVADLCYRAWNDDWRVVCNPAVKIQGNFLESGGHFDVVSEAEFKAAYQSVHDRFSNKNLGLVDGRCSVVPRVARSFSDGPIKILFFSHNMNLEGASFSLFEMVLGLKNRGVIDPVVISIQDGPLAKKYSSEGVCVRIISHPLARTISLNSYETALQSLAKEIVQHQPVVVYANTLKLFFVIDTAKKIGIPSIWNIRESEPWQAYFKSYGAAIESRALSCFQYPYRVVFVAHATQGLFCGLNTRLNQMVISNALNVNRFSSGADARNNDELRTSLGIDGKDIVALCVGSVCERKGQLDIVEALELLSPEVLKRIHVVIVGDNNGSYAKLLKKNVGRWNLELARRLHFVIETDEVWQYYNSADLFICSSRMESYPRVILEAMAAGLAIVSTPVNGIVEQLRENQNAFYYQPGDQSALSSAITRLVDDNELRIRFGEASKLLLGGLTTFSGLIRSYETEFVQASQLSNRGIVNEH